MEMSPASISLYRFVDGSRNDCLLWTSTCWTSMPNNGLRVIVVHRPRTGILGRGGRSRPQRIDFTTEAIH